MPATMLADRVIVAILCLTVFWLLLAFGAFLPLCTWIFVHEMIDVTDRP
jgi:hypothetical protein